MINQDKWISSLSRKNIRFSNTTNQLDHDRWINTIPKKNTHNSVQKYSLNSVQKYSLITILFLVYLFQFIPPRLYKYISVFLSSNGNLICINY